MERRVIILVISALAVIGVAAWALWPRSGPPVTAPPPTIGSASTLPQPTQSTSPSTSSVPTSAAPSPSHSAVVVGGDGQSTGPATSEQAQMLAVAAEYLTTQYTLDYSAAPGFDYKKLMTLSSGALLNAHKDMLPLWQDPSGSDLRVNAEMNSKSPGGVYKQTVKIDGSWLTPYDSMVVADISTSNSLKYNEMSEESFTIYVEQCGTNSYGWCVKSVEQTPQQ